MKKSHVSCIWESRLCTKAKNKKYRCTVGVDNSEHSYRIELYLKDFETVAMAEEYFSEKEKKNKLC